ncbi:hypothetical protein PVAG01_02872 [Phlyctema vagabunda]|uniref:Uncharacterized protein n=1 Tax=Phlyctema vagabunda TaxID=108571 RepID=A0ABR4PT55_9HELO
MFEPKRRHQDQQLSRMKGVNLGSLAQSQRQLNPARPIFFRDLIFHSVDTDDPFIDSGNKTNASNNRTDTIHSHFLRAQPQQHNRISTFSTSNRNMASAITSNHLRSLRAEIMDEEAGEPYVSGEFTMEEITASVEPMDADCSSMKSEDEVAMEVDIKKENVMDEDYPLLIASHSYESSLNPSSSSHWSAKEKFTTKSSPNSSLKPGSISKRRGENKHSISSPVLSNKVINGGIKPKAGIKIRIPWFSKAKARLSSQTATDVLVAAAAESPTTLSRFVTPTPPASPSTTLSTPGSTDGDIPMADKTNGRRSRVTGRGILSAPAIGTGTPQTPKKKRRSPINRATPAGGRSPVKKSADVDQIVQILASIELSAQDARVSLVKTGTTVEVREVDELFEGGYDGDQEML